MTDWDSILREAQTAQVGPFGVTVAVDRIPEGAPVICKVNAVAHGIAVTRGRESAGADTHDWPLCDCDHPVPHYACDHDEIAEGRTD